MCRSALLLSRTCFTSSASMGLSSFNLSVRSLWTVDLLILKWRAAPRTVEPVSMT